MSEVEGAPERPVVSSNGQGEAGRASVHIDWLIDSNDCETCGPSYAEGALVKLDGKLVLELRPSAHCYAGTSYDRSEVYQMLLEHLGHAVTEDHEPLAALQETKP